jgi:hypothetical protein
VEIIDRLSFDYYNFKHKDQLVIEAAIKMFRSYFKDKEFIENVRERNFSYTDDNGAEVLVNLVEYITTEYDRIYIKPFYVPWYKWWMKKVRAYVYPKTQRNVIYLNASYPQRNQQKLAGTITHELMHLISYGHGSNKPHGAPYYNSVPCKVASLVRYFRESFTF